MRPRIAVAIVVALGACTPAWQQGPHDQLFQYEPPRRLIRKPAGSDVSDWWDRGDLRLVRPLGRLISPGSYARILVGGRAAQDVNRLGQVPDSAWFENRIGRRDYAIEAAADGAAADAFLAPGPLAVISGKIEGVSAGFVIRDTANQIWYLKLDHPAFPELSTSAEVISSRLLWLAGYRVPAMLVVDIEPRRFVLDSGARTKDRYNRSVPLTRASLDALLANTNPDAEGRIRALISRQPPGEILGPFSYRGTRKDDPNDVIDHEHRRSLRGLWVFAAWINNTDTRDANTLDMFRPVGRDGRGVVEHYLIDFGDSFGASGLGEKSASEGWEHLLDWGAMVKNLFMVGLRHPGYEKVKRSAFRSVGLFESVLFDPSQWRPSLPNSAFEERTRGDELWAASILARIQPALIEAAVGAGHYREEGAAAYVVETLLARREKLLEHAFVGYLELDRPRTQGAVLSLDNLRVLGGLEYPGPIRYEVRWRGRVVARGSVDARQPAVTVDLSRALATVRAAGTGADPYLTVTFGREKTRLAVHLRIAGDRVAPIAVTR